MDTNNTPLDNELAALTDAILDGKDFATQGDLEGLDTVARQLGQLMSPDQGPDAAFRARLTQRLAQEWDATQVRSARRQSISPNTRRYLALAAVLVVVVGLAFVIRPGGPLAGSTVTSGDFSWPILVILAAVLGIAGYILWRRQK